MRRAALLGILLLGASPQDPETLIEKLRADDITERERAFLEIEKAGAAAEASLKKAVGSSDPAVDLQVRRLLRILELERLFSPALKRAIPGLSRRITMDETTQWTAVYGEAWEAGGRPSPRFPRLTREDLEPLALPALQRASDPELKIAVSRIAANWGHRTSVPELVRLLKDPNEKVARSALSALSELEGRGAVALAVAGAPDSLLESCLHEFKDMEPVEFEPRLMEMTFNGNPRQIAAALGELSSLNSLKLSSRLLDLLEHPHSSVRVAAINSARCEPDPRYVSSILRGIRNSHADVRLAAAQYAVGNAVTPTFPDVAHLAGDKSPEIRAAAMSLARRTSGNEKYELLVRGLSDGELGVRIQAAVALGEVGKPEHAALLKRGLRDSEPDFRRIVLGSLCVLQGREAVPALRDVLFSESHEAHERTWALELLLKVGAPPTEKEWIDLIEKSSIDLAGRVAHELASFNPRLITPACIESLIKNSGGDPNWMILDTIARSRCASAVPFLLQLFDKGYSTRVRAARALNLFPETNPAPSVRPLLAHENPQVRRMAAEVVGNWEDAAASEQLAQLLNDDDESVVRAAVYALDRIGLGSSFPKVQELLGHDSQWLRENAAETLARHGDRTSIPTLRTWLEKPESREVALEALFDLGDREFTDKLAGWLPEDHDRTLRDLITLLRPPGALPVLLDRLKELDAGTRREAVELIGRWGDASLATQLLPLLSQPAVASAVVEAIVALKADGVTSDLVKLLGNPDVSIRMSALEALTGLDARGAAPAIRPLLRDPDSGVRLEAASAAGRLQDREAIQALTALLEDPSPAVRWVAAGSLEELKAHGACPALMSRLDDPSETVRRAARSALVSLGSPEFRVEAIRRFRDSRTSERRAYLNVLSDLKASEAVAELMALSSDDALGNDACWELGELGERDALRKIARAGLHKRVAVKALAPLEDPAVLESWLEDPDATVRYLAAQVLCGQGNRQAVPEVLRRAVELSRSHLPYEYSDS